MGEHDHLSSVGSSPNPNRVSGPSSMQQNTPKVDKPVQETQRLQEQKPLVDMDALVEKVSDVVVYSDPSAMYQQWKVLCKASSESQGWMKSTKYMNLPNGCLVQVSTQQRNPDGSYALAESVIYVPGATF